MCDVLPDNKLQLTVCDTHGLVDNGIIIIGTTVVSVIDVIDGEKIIISGAICPIETEITIPAAKYLHGTIKATSYELTLIKSSRERFQIVYLY